MTRFNYAFCLTLENSGDYTLKFLDIPQITLTGTTRDHIFSQAQSTLDDFLYTILKKGGKIPIARAKASADKCLSPSDAIRDALEFYVMA